METLIVLLSIVLSCRAQTWLNALDQHLQFQCSPRHTVSKMFSIHDNGAEDRRFSLDCAALPNDDGVSTETCFWETNYVNDLDKPFAYSCPTNHYIAGMQSDHDNKAEDRRWKYYCCALNTYHLEDCSYSGWLNTYDGNIDYTIPTGKVLRGVTSVHDNGAEDRIYDFEYCALKKILDESQIAG